MPVEPGKAPTAAIIGFACLLGATTLAWLSSPATLQLARDNEDRVAAALESRLFGLFTNRAERVDGIRSVSLVQYREPGDSEGTPDRLVFQTAKGAVDLGRNQQLFAVDYPEIDRFIKADGPPSLTLSSIARGSELRRFVFAQIVAVCMFLGGLGLEWAVISGLRARSRNARA